VRNRHLYSTVVGFYRDALHALQRRLGCRKSVRRESVCPPVKRVNCDKTKETDAHFLIPNERAMHLLLRDEKWLVENAPSA